MTTKLLRREPTVEMCIAPRLKDWPEWGPTFLEVFQAMFDAAPEIEALPTAAPPTAEVRQQAKLFRWLRQQGCQWFEGSGTWRSSHRLEITATAAMHADETFMRLDREPDEALPAAAPRQICDMPSPCPTPIDCWIARDCLRSSAPAPLPGPPLHEQLLMLARSDAPLGDDERATLRRAASILVEGDCVIAPKLPDTDSTAKGLSPVGDDAGERK